MTRIDTFPLCPRCGEPMNTRRDGINMIGDVQYCADCWVDLTVASITQTAPQPVDKRVTA